MLISTPGTTKAEALLSPSYFFCHSISLHHVKEKD